MNKTKKVAGISFALLFTLSVLGVSASSSGTLTVLVPRLGQMSKSVGNISKSNTSTPGTLYLNTSPYTYRVYGDFAKPNYAQNANVRISDSYYPLTERSNTKIYCGDIKSGTRVAGRIGSSNAEIDERYVTFSYNPD